MTKEPNRIWVDGCFDFFHHGHAGALNQARALGDELVVGIHTDEAILANKGPVVMNLPERVLAVDACRWTTEEVEDAPYVTQFAVMDRSGCHYVAHGDDITTDADGNDCYQEAKDAGRFLEFKRTPNISTTDLIGRMLSHTTQHHGEASTAFLESKDAQTRFNMYATSADARTPYAGVFNLVDSHFKEYVKPAWTTTGIIYTEGTFDLFHSGHIEFLKSVSESREPGQKVVVGLRSDASVNEVLGNGRPIMNIFERALSVLQCKYVDAIILNLPRSHDGKHRVESIEALFGKPVVTVARGPKPIQDGLIEYAKETGKLLQIKAGTYAELSTQTIINRVLSNREQYEERQRKKGVKSLNEKDMESKERASRQQPISA